MEVLAREPIGDAGLDARDPQLVVDLGEAPEEGEGDEEEVVSLLAPEVREEAGRRG
ncbi:MAG: hypothetical protein P1V51_08390 [Deltaproteobacteria bacterium]|nr:hypothetical protein [Deltaproteobacteria bacterium]